MQLCGLTAVTIQNKTIYIHKSHDNSDCPSLIHITLIQYLMCIFNNKTKILFFFFLSKSSNLYRAASCMTASK